MRVVAMFVAVSMLFSMNCKKKNLEEAVDAVAAATTPVTPAAVPTANCPACPAAAACPACAECAVCAVCADPMALSKAALDAETTLKFSPPAGLTFTVEKAGEYQIDASAGDLDPIVRLYKGEEKLGEDDDGGVDRNARLFAFLQPGEYVARVGEVNWMPCEPKVKIAAAAPFTSAGAVALGGTLEVSVPEVTDDNRGIVEATLEITEAGKYTVEAAGTGEVDAVLTLIKDNVVVAENDDFDSSVNRNARIEADLQPGTYVLRVTEAHDAAGTVQLSAGRTE
ncbi:MAG: hypothetical protein HY905_22890 [Deltaproteobacteria bacterium]|nr:hypothetical protein [Deltaproteobacteria bacterium]